MQNPRFHGAPPYRAVAVHGGPGAQGSIYPVAKELGRHGGVLEPMQTVRTVDGQVEELCVAIRAHAAPPVILAGHSWGAWLAFLVAARHPELVSKLILVGSGPFEERWTAGMMDTRLSHLSPEEAQEARAIMAGLGEAPAAERDALFSRMGELMGRADTYCPAPAGEPYESACDADVHESVWAEAATLRRCGALLAEAARIACPVLAIHGDYDPHPWQGVKEPLEGVVGDFRFMLLERCGHEPWAELYARDRFFAVLREELTGGPGGQIEGEGFALRPVDERDADAILEVYRQCEDFLALGPAPASMAMVLDDLKHSRCEGGVFCGIFVGDELAGVVDFVAEGYEGRQDRAFLSLLMIARAHRGRGLGRRVVEAVEAQMLQSGAREICSGVQANNPAAIAFWQRMGYRVTAGPTVFADATVAYDLHKAVSPASKMKRRT